MTLQQYIDSVARRFASGISREHTYRSDLEVLLRAMVTTVEITNEPANVTDCGNPDYVITKGKIPIGYIEAKDIAKDLNSKSYKEQFGRYRNALDNLIITDYLWFQFFQNGEMVHEIRIGEIVDGKVKPLPENFDKFVNLIQDFCTFVSQTIKSSKKLAVMMAAKARLLQDILEQAVESDEQTQANTSLKAQYETFKDILIHDLKPKGFADIYAQTLAYGMFAARLNDDTIDTFSRQEAAELIPKSNPFLRKLFGYVAGPDIDERIKPTVENLAEVFRHTNVEELLKNFGNSTQTNDPIIHFYETFLAEYDPKLRKSRGVWYTPEPVVSFIVRAVDDILKTEFGLTQGLADTTKTKIKVDVQGKTIEQEVHKVQILDPATGTGTFLAEVVKFIYNTNFKQMQGMWSSYVDEHLIPRLNGFELLMASYAMAHLKLSMLLAETGYKNSPQKGGVSAGRGGTDQRLNVYLTNSLEEHHKDTGTIFSSWLSQESNEANRIKRDVPVMCVIGNPPYSVSSSNKGEWIQNLIKDYKKDLNEKKLNLDDDYIKFIRYGQHYIEKNGEGILAYISNNSFIDGITHRQMRKNLLETFDKIYILDLHGNSKKKETAPDGGKDENVFDIMQGVSINIFVKRGCEMEENQVYEKKSLKLFTKKNPDWNKLIKECVCLANRTGGIIEIGIEDDSDYPPANQKIPIKLRNDIQSKIENNTMNVGVEVISQVHNSSEYLKVVVKRNKEAIASTTSGRYFIRVGEECKPLLPDELQRLMEDKSSFTWELKTNLNLDISIYDREKASDFIDSITKSNRVTKFIKDKTFEEILAHYFLIDGNKFTNLGVLWIGKREQRARLSYAPAVQVIKYDSTEKKIRKDSYDDYSLNPQELIQTIWDKTPEFKYFEEISDGIYRKNIYDYDEKVIRELLANCIVHRPYTTRGDIFINIFEDRIEFHNPGLLPIPVTPKNILHESVPRNQHLASLFYALNLMEKEGSGYDKIYEQLLFSGKQLPVVEELEDRVKVTIFKAIIDKDVIRFLNNVSKEFELKTKEKLTLGIIAQHHSLSLTEISDIIGLEEVKVDRDWISGLLEKNILVKKGKTSGMQYLINPKLLKNYKFKGRTNLKTIENHRLKELIREDLSKFPMSNRSDIHERIGKEINTRRVRQILKIMQDENIIKKIGNTSNTVYTLKDIKQK